MNPRVEELLDGLEVQHSVIGPALTQGERDNLARSMSALRTALSEPEAYVRPHDGRSPYTHDETAQPVYKTEVVTPTYIKTERGQKINASAAHALAGTYDPAIKRFPTPTEMARAQQAEWAKEPVLECLTCSWRGDDRIEAIDVGGHKECPQCGDRNNLRVRR